MSRFTESDLKNILNDIAHNNLDGSRNYDFGEDNYFSIVPATLDESPTDTPLLMVSGDWNYYSDGEEINDLPLFLSNGSVYTKLASRTRNKLNSFSTKSKLFLDTKNALLPSALFNNQIEVDEIYYINKRMKNQPMFIPLENIIYKGEELVNKDTVIELSSESLTFTDLLLCKLEAELEGAKHSTLRYSMELNKKLEVCVNTVVSGYSPNKPSVFILDWCNPIVHSTSEVIRNHISVATSVINPKVKLISNYAAYMNENIHVERESFQKELFVSIPKELVLADNLIPVHASAYLLEYLGKAAFGKLLELYTNNEMNKFSVAKVCKILPNNLFNYKQVLNNEHMIPRGRGRDKSMIFG